MYHVWFLFYTFHEPDDLDKRHLRAVQAGGQESTGEINGVYLLSPGGPRFVNNGSEIMFMSKQPRNSTCGEGPIINNNVVRGPHVAKLEFDGETVRLAKHW